MKELKLKYGCNSNQIPAKLYLSDGENLPFRVLNGNPGYINFLDALNGWQLVLELKKATKMAAAASFKHFSPAGVALGTPVSLELQKAFMIDDLKLTSPVALAYAKARGADRMSSYGDWVALSDECDEQTANVLKREVSDGIVAPSFTLEALNILKSKKKGLYNIVQIDESYRPCDVERREIFGVVFEQKRNNVEITDELFENIVTKNKNLSKEILVNLKMAAITLKYTQSNSVCFAFNDIAVGIGAGQQSRVDCTKLAGRKAESFFLRQHPKILNLPFLSGLKRGVKDNLINIFTKNEAETFLKNYDWHEFFSRKPCVLTVQEIKDWIYSFDGICLSSDGFFPFSDNIEVANEFNAKYICQPGGSIRDDEVIKMCDRFNMCMVMTGTRLFFH